MEDRYLELNVNLFGFLQDPGAYFERLFSSLVMNSNKAGTPLSIATRALPIAGIISEGSSTLSA